MERNENIKVRVIADDVVSPLGVGSEENLEAVLAISGGESPCGGYALPGDEAAEGGEEWSGSVHLHKGTFGLPEPFVASLFDRLKMEEVFSREGIPSEAEGYSFLERISVLSASRAIAASGIDPSSPDTVFVLSSTKGNIWTTIGSSAGKIASWFGNSVSPIAISNACISGVCAEIEALRLLRGGEFRTAVVIGVDVQSKFIVSGFQSFKALSPELCRPFDRDRRGLNLGEAAATVVLQRSSFSSCSAAGPEASKREGSSESSSTGWEIDEGCIRNDANHISGPSRTGEGSFLALEYLLESGAVKAEDLAAVNVHGTATAYNDEMESIALSRAGLSEVPVNSLKGFFGHTMGAAGVLETILSMHATTRGLVLPTRGFENPGVSCPVNVSAGLRTTDKRSFVKLISGFGGCNAAVAFRLSEGGAECGAASCGETSCSCVSDSCSASSQGGDTALETLGTIDITPDTIILNGNKLDIRGTGREEVHEAFRSLGIDYVKFFKMDPLAKLGFVASELLLNAVEPGERPVPRKDRGVILCNRSASLCNDLHYEKTIEDPANWFPSPALFVYTLPNISCGEIAIRNKWYGETMFFIAEEYDAEAFRRTVKREFQDRGLDSALCGYLECTDEDEFEAHLGLVKRKLK